MMLPPLIDFHTELLSLIDIAITRRRYADTFAFLFTPVILLRLCFACAAGCRLLRLYFFAYFSRFLRCRFHADARLCFAALPALLYAAVFFFDAYAY